MAFQKGHPRYGGRPKGQGNNVSPTVRQLCMEAGPELIAGLLHIARNSRSEAMELAATQQLLDRGFGRPKIFAENEVTVGISGELARVLAATDGQSRSIPTPRTNGSLLTIEHDADHGGEVNGNGNANVPQ